MNQFLPNFLRDAKRYLTELRRDLQKLNENETHERAANQTIRRIFQTLHTLKGSASIFELTAVSGLAHRLETAISRCESGENKFEDSTAKILSDGFDRLEQLLQTIEHGDLSAGKIFDQTADSNQIDVQIKPAHDFANEVLPHEIVARLDEREKIRLAAALQRNCGAAILEVSFEFAEFAEKSDGLRRALLKNHEIIAALPAENQTSAKLVLRFVVASDSDEAETNRIATQFNGAIVFSSRTADALQLTDLIDIAFTAGRQTAERAGKTVDFFRRGTEPKLSAAQSAAVSIALLHLIRNAIAHGIEIGRDRISANKSQNGKVIVETGANADAIEIRISDDGRGIDREKLPRKSVENRRTATQINDSDDSENPLDVIFQPGFSTFETITEDAGRGIGLDAVVAALQKINGSIAVESEIERGTIFTITLPTDY